MSSEQKEAADDKTKVGDEKTVEEDNNLVDKSEGKTVVPGDANGDETKNVEAVTSEPEAKEENKPKKRGAERQITKDDRADDDDDEGEEEINTGPFKKASAEVMKTRRILKVKRPAAPSGADNMPSIPEDKEATPDEAPKEDTAEKEKSSLESIETKEKAEVDTASSSKPSEAATASSFSAAAKTNPFANISFSSGNGFGAPKSATPTFGAGAKFGSVGTSGFAFDGTKATDKSATDRAQEETKRASPSNLGVFGRGASITGFGSSKADDSSGGNLIGFGAAAAAAPSGFGNLSSGSAPASNSAPLSSTPAWSFTSQNNSASNRSGGDSIFPTVAADAGDPVNGEENETCILEIRAKSFHWVDKKPTTSTVDEAASEEKKENPDSSGDKEGSNEGDKPSTADEETAEQEEKKDETENKGKKPQAVLTAEKEWKEVGLGPLRILKHTTENARHRIVQRRGTGLSGAGTTVILNLVVTATETHVERHAEKHVRLTTVLPDEKCPGTFLFRVKTVAEADELSEALTKAIKETATAAEKSQTDPQQEVVASKE